MKEGSQNDGKSISKMRRIFLSNCNKDISKLEKIIIRVSDVLVMVSAIMVTIMMLVAVLDVILVSVFKVPFIGGTEIVQILNVGIIVALAGGTLMGQHVTVDFVAEKLKMKQRFYVQLAADIINLIVLGLLTVASYKYIFVIYKKKAVFSMLQIQEWPFVIVMTVGLAGGVLAMLVVLIQHIREHKHGAVVDTEPIILPYQAEAKGKDEPIKTGEVIVHMDDMADKGTYDKKGKGDNTK